MSLALLFYFVFERGSCLGWPRIESILLLPFPNRWDYSISHHAQLVCFDFCVVLRQSLTYVAQAGLQFCLSVLCAVIAGVYHYVCHSGITFLEADSNTSKPGLRRYFLYRARE